MLALAVARYRLGFARAVRQELDHWREQALAIDDPRLRALALRKLEAEGFNAKAAVMLATFVERRHRISVVRAIVALEVLFDYLDGRTEPANGSDPLRWRRALFATFTWAVAGAGVEGAPLLADGDAGYLLALARTVRASLERLPGARRVRPAVLRAGARAAEAQARTHAVGELGEAQLRAWAEATREDEALGWREYHAGACASVLAIHALIVAAADPPRRDRDLEAIDQLYLRIGAVASLLDHVVDHELDGSLVSAGGLRFYRDDAELRRSLLALLAQTSAMAGERERRRRDLMTLAGVLGYYMSAPGAKSAFAAPIADAVHEQQGQALLPAYALMRAWRRIGRVKATAGTRAGDL
jgi:hypothetical protein